MNKKIQKWINGAFVVFLILIIASVPFARKQAQAAYDKVLACEEELKSLQIAADQTRREFEAERKQLRQQLEECQRSGRNGL